MNVSAGLPHAEWPYLQIIVRCVLGLALGLLIGLERERRGKEAGLRTFGFVSILGTIGGALGTPYAVSVLWLTAILLIILNVQSLRTNQGTELTTSAAMLVTALCGVLVGLGHTIAPAAIMVLSTALLAWKERLSGFTMGLTESELRSALLLAILAIVIYPALPVGAVGPWGLVEPRAAWVTVILIAAIGFFNYVIWKIYGARGTEISGFFGGLVNSTFTVIELTTRVRQIGASFVETAYRGILLAVTAMVVRNATLLLLLAPMALVGSVPAYALMLAACVLLVVISYRTPLAGQAGAPALTLDLPFSLPQALKYGFLFLVLHVLGGMTERQFGDLGFYFICVVGGALSSASAVAAAAALSAQGSITPTVAGTGAVIASFTSIAFTLVFITRARNKALMSRMVWSMGWVALAGVAGVLLSHLAEPWIMHWVPRLTGLPDLPRR
ncbi:magnesium transporter accessory protein [Comamonas serinivorans]|uniref:Magnesium transporter accessory protein n=1 Tax=Comamonas serinivorans TaxID=1082851 RepID=A0A1Y0ETD6_9BURK|nr:magnesium transporter accessory protein [Comamonas serinivorans]